jgi:hypothetical protein
MEQKAKPVSFQQRWRETRPTKTAVAWSWVGAVIATLIVGFTWGGWVTGGTARAMAKETGEEAVVKRLAPICVVQFNHDPKKDQKAKELQGVNGWEKGDYIKKQGWATMPGEAEPDGRVADACAKLI